jgi:hypothetical protein
MELGRFIKTKNNPFEIFHVNPPLPRVHVGIYVSEGFNFLNKVVAKACHKFNTGHEREMAYPLTRKVDASGAKNTHSPINSVFMQVSNPAHLNNMEDTIVNENILADQFGSDKLVAMAKHLKDEEDKQDS